MYFRISNIWSQKKLCYASLDYSEPFTIYTDASKYQVGVTVKQDKFPMSYFYIKLHPFNMYMDKLISNLMLSVYCVYRMKTKEYKPC